MFSGMDRVVVNVAVAILAFVGVSGAVSPWFEGIYSGIAFWVLIIGLPLGALVYWIKGLDLDLDREIRRAKTQNAAAVATLDALHTAHPEVAEELAARMLAEKLARQQGEQGVIPPNSGA